MATLADHAVWYWDLGTAGATETDSIGGVVLNKRDTVIVSTGGAPDGGDCIDCGNQAGKYQNSSVSKPFTFANGFTANIWVYRTAGTPSSNEIVFSFRDANVGSGGDDYFQMSVNRISDNTDQGVVFDAANSTRQPANTRETTDVWQMLTLTDDGTTATLYRNAVSVATDATSLGARDSGAAGLAIGGIGWATAAGTNDLFGRAFAAGLWSIVLPPAGITALYNSGAGVRYSALASTSYGGVSPLLFDERMHSGGLSEMYGGVH